VAKPAALVRFFGAAVTAAHAEQDPAYLGRWLRSFTSVTPENAMKWEVIEPERGRWNWGEADAIVDAAVKTGKRVRGHPLVWDLQLPPWVRDGSFDAKAMEAVIREHVRTLVSRYKGRVAQWDVVNEPLEENGTLTRSVFYQALGERFIDVAFDEAHRADPQAKLFLNELAAERPGPKQTALLALVKRLEHRGVPIDGIGLQNHTNVRDAPTKDDLSATIDRFAKLGLKTEITEMDVGIAPTTSLQAQAAAYAAAASACGTNRSCTGLTVWGVMDPYSWLGPAVRPLPFGAAGTPKPAAAALAGALVKRSR
jgi:endo-1,4-beta-xylanase